MNIVVRKYEKSDVPQMVEIWNEIVNEGKAFPEEDPLSHEDAYLFFQEKTFAGVAVENGEILGLYVIQPNNVGRCGHIANASYGVKSNQQGKGIGEKLVLHSLEAAASFGFRIMQFNAVVTTNEAAIHLYKKLGFHSLGVIPGGFRQRNDKYVDIMLFYKVINPLF